MSVHVLESSVPIKARKIYTDIHGGCSEAVKILPEVYGHCWKPQGLIGMVLGEGHGYEISVRIFMDIPGGVYGQYGWGLWIRTIRTGFPDTFLIY